jgi:hypothetical protein
MSRIEAAKLADAREQHLKRERLRRPDGCTRKPIIWHTLTPAQPDDDANANADWVDFHIARALSLVTLVAIAWRLS